MKKTLSLSLLSLVALSGCTAYMPMRYQIEPDSNVALKTLGGAEAGGIAVGRFAGPAGFSNLCRQLNPITPPEGQSFEGYVQKALASELKVAGLYDEKSPRVTLTGALERLEFNTVRTVVGGGVWEMGLRVQSSNGQSLSVDNRYEFTTGYYADTACKQTAEAFMPAVQTLLHKLVTAPEFKTLLAAPDPAPATAAAPAPTPAAR